MCHEANLHADHEKLHFKETMVTMKFSTMNFFFLQVFMLAVLEFYFFFRDNSKTERKKFSIRAFSVTLTVLISVLSGEVYSKIQLMSLCKQNTVKQIKLAELPEAFYCSESCSSYRVCIAGEKKNSV